MMNDTLEYIIAQIIGGLIGGLLVYTQYKQPLDAITAELTLAGARAEVFTTSGVSLFLQLYRIINADNVRYVQPASPIALFTGPGQQIGLVFVNEFIGAFVIAVGVFSILDPSNSKSRVLYYRY